MNIRRALAGIFLLAVLPVAASAFRRNNRGNLALEPAIVPSSNVDSQPHPPISIEGSGLKDTSEPGGSAVVFGLFGFIILIAMWVSTFIFPPGFVAAVLVFGPVSALGLVVLFLHLRVHSAKD